MRTIKELQQLINPSYEYNGYFYRPIVTIIKISEITGEEYLELNSVILTPNGDIWTVTGLDDSLGIGKDKDDIISKLKAATNDLKNIPSITEEEANSINKSWEGRAPY